MKLALVISSLGGGGAERVMATLANAWAQRGLKITLITLSDAKSDVYPLDARVERICLGLIRPSAHIGQALANNFRRIRALRKALLAVKPELTLSFLTTTNMLTILACLRTDIQAVVSERISIADSPPPNLWAIPYRSVYRQAAAVVTLTARGATWLESRLGISTRVIPNPLFIEEEPERGVPEANALLQTARGGHKLLAVGRLHAQKGFDLLLQAFAQVASEHPDWTLVILGEGPERKALETQARALGLGGRAILHGFFEYAQAAMRQADAFVLSSRYEGMPNALLEAMACGLPCVSFDCRTGPAELIEPGVNGLLVPAEDVGALAEALARLMDNSSLRQRFGAEARVVRTRFSLDSVLAQWDALIASVVDRRNEGPKHRESTRTVDL